MNRMKKSYVKLIVLALTAVLALSLYGCKKDEVTKDPIDILAPEDEKTDASVGTGLSTVDMISAGSVHNAALRSDGTVVTSGHDTIGQRKTNGWINIVNVAAGKTVTVGVKADGSVVYAGSLNGIDAISTWTNIAKVAAGNEHVVGVTKDGKVVALGNNAQGACDVAAWSDVVAVAAGANHSVGLKKDGSVVVTSNGGDTSAWKDIVAVSAGNGFTVGVDKNGKCYSTGKVDVSSWSGVAAIAAGGDGIVAGIKNDGSILYAGPYAPSEAISGAVDVSAGDNHVLVMLKDGSVKAFGKNDDLQCDTSRLFLRPIVKEVSGVKYVFGFAPSVPLSLVKDGIESVVGAPVTFARDGADLPLTQGAHTGIEIKANGASYGYMVIRGDVDGDGVISLNDSTLLEQHIAGTITLDGANLEAAKIATDGAGNVISVALEMIQSSAKGNDAISQYVLDKTYDESFKKQYASNDDVVGWFKVEGTNIDYPIMFDASGNYYYNDHTPDGTKTDAGSIYTYFNSYFVKNNIVTGHNARVTQTMFHELQHIQEYNNGEKKCLHTKRCTAELTDKLPDLDVYSERVWDVEIFGVDSKWEVFAYYETRGDVSLEKSLYDNIWFNAGKYKFAKETDAKVEEWIKKQVDLSEKDLGVKVSADDTFMTIVTCATEYSDKYGENGRLYWFLKRVD